jgi:predicted amidophosphoribosyltransferase
MSVPERVCEECGAINREDAETCWRCLASLEQPAASTPGARARPLA